MERWFADYRSGDTERLGAMRMELNALLRRGLIEGPHWLRPPLNERSDDRSLGAVHVRHVVAMVRHILENLTDPMTNADVTAVTGLHENYALAIFSRTMRMPMKRFIIRMRLIRARALLVESPLAISSVAEMSGFASLSQFYKHFRQAYDVAPHALRTRVGRPSGSSLSESRAAPGPGSLDPLPARIDRGNQPTVELSRPRFAPAARKDSATERQG